MKTTTILMTCFLLLGSLYALQLPCSSITMTPSPANASGNITLNVTPSGQSYLLNFTDFNGVVYQSGTSEIFYVPANYSSTRVVIKAFFTNGTLACTNFTLIYSSAQQTVQNNLVSNNIIDWFNSYASLILGIFTAGIAYGLSSKIGHAAVATSIMYAGLYLILVNPLFLWGAFALLVAGLVLIYANI